MLVPNRHASTNAYRYGFQGQEKDDEIKGEGNSLNYTFRMHDPRVGRFFAVDPLTHKYPWYSPYSFSGNRVIAFTELEGLEEKSVIKIADKFRYYVVQKSDNLSVISKKTNVELNEILKNNTFITDPNKIYPGQFLDLIGEENLKESTFKVDSRTKDEIRKEYWSAVWEELNTTNENGVSISTQLDVVAYADGAAALTSVPKLLRSGYKGIKTFIGPKPAQKIPVIEAAPKISSVDDVSKIIASNLRNQKQLAEHTIGGSRLGSNSYLNSIDDAKKVLDATNNGKATILGKNTLQNRVYVEYKGVTGRYNNNGTIIETNKFMIKGRESSTVVPVHPNSTKFE